MALDPVAVKTPQTVEWWMDQLSRRMLDPARMKHLGTMQAYVDNQPPLVTTSDSQRRAFHAFCRLARIGLAGAVVRSRVNRMMVRSIRTAAADDDRGDKVANLYWTSALRTAAADVHQDLCGLAEGYVRVMVDPVTGRPVGVRRDPRYCITAQDPLNPSRTLAAMELAWDEWAGRLYAYLWLPGGQQWVAEREMKSRPPMYTPPNVFPSMEEQPVTPYWKLSFSPASFTMRPQRDDVPEGEDDGRPYSESYDTDRVPFVLFPARNRQTVFQVAIPTLKRANQKLLQTLTTAAVQAYKQRALKQDDTGTTQDRLPAVNPHTQETINYDDLFEPGPDALWKLPPGVSIWESGQIDMTPFIAGETATIKQFAMETGTPVPLLSDDVNQSAEGAQLRREDLVASVSDLQAVAGEAWATVLSLMFEMAPDEDRYAVGDDGTRVDRADAGRIVMDWFPAERFSMQERASADSLNKSLSRDMAATRIWGLTPDEVEINKRQLASDGLLAAQAKAGAGAVPTG